MKLVSQELSAESLTGIGHLLSSSASPEQAQTSADGFSYDVILADIGLTAGLSAGHLRCAARELTLTKLERHLHTPELLLAMEGDALICVAPPQEPKDGKLEGLKALRVTKGQALVLDTGAWHWIPFPVTPQAARFLVVFRSTTGADDLHFCELAQALTLKLN